MLKFDEANALVIEKRLNDKQIFILKVPYLVEESLLKRMWLYHKMISLERKVSTIFLIFEQVVQLLKEVCVTLPSDGKDLIWTSLILKKCNVRQDVMTFVSNIFKSLNAVNFKKGYAFVRFNVNQCQGVMPREKKHFSPLIPLWHGI